MGKTYRNGPKGRVRENTKRQMREDRTEQNPGIPSYARAEFSLEEAFSVEDMEESFTEYLEVKETPASYGGAGARSRVVNASERILEYGVGRVGAEELIATLTGKEVELTAEQVIEISWRSPEELMAVGWTKAQATKLAAAFEIGRRVGWAPPVRGERCLDPRRVYELLRREAHEEKESFFIVMLDVRGRLLGYERISQGSLSQCPVSPRDALRPPVRQGAHSVVFVHNHPSGDPSPSSDDVDLTERLRAACELVGVLARDHVIIAAGGYYSFVEAGRWHR